MGCFVSSSSPTHPHKSLSNTSTPLLCVSVPITCNGFIHQSALRFGCGLVHPVDFFGLGALRGIHCDLHSLLTQKPAAKGRLSHLLLSWVRPHPDFPYSTVVSSSLRMFLVQGFALLTDHKGSLRGLGKTFTLPLLRKELRKGHSPRRQ